MQSNIIELMAQLRQKLDLEMEKRTQQEDALLAVSSDEIAQLGAVLNAKRKALRLDMQSLEWQTGISISTLKRLFKDPSQVKFMTVVQVAETLGVKLCFAK